MYFHPAHNEDNLGLLPPLILRNFCQLSSAITANHFKITSDIGLALINTGLRFEKFTRTNLRCCCRNYELLVFRICRGNKLIVYVYAFCVKVVA